MTLTYPLTSVLLAFVPPQTPEGNGTAKNTPAIAHAQAFPDNTLACVSLRATKPQLDALGKQKVVAALLDSMAQRGLTAAALDARLQEGSGQTLAQWLALLHGGVTMGVTEVDDKGQPHWLLVADVQDQAAVFSAMLDRARQAPGAGAVDGKARTWLVTTPLGRIAFAVAENRLLAGDSAASVSEALARLRATSARGTLASTPGLTDFEVATATHKQRVFAAFVHPTMLCERALLAMPAASGNKVRGVLRALDVTRISAGGVSIELQGEELVETYHFDWPAPRNGPLAELVAPKASLRPEVAALIPADVAAFSASAVDLQRVFHSGMRLFSELAPRQAQNVQGMIAQWGQRMGIDVHDDLLAKIAPQMVTLQWMQDGTAETAVIVQLTDGPHFDRALRRAVGAFGDTVREQDVNGYRTFAFGATDGPQLTVAEDNLVLASTAQALRRALDQIAAPRGAQAAASIPKGASAYGSTRLDTFCDQVETAMAQAGRMPEAWNDSAGSTLRSVRQVLAGAVLRTTCTRDDRNVGLVLQSPVGGLLTLGALGGATVGLPLWFAHTEQQVGLARTLSALPATLLRVVAAQRQFQTRNQGMPARTLRSLIAAGLLTESDLGTPVDDAVFERDGYKISLLLHDSDAGTFIAVAWPAGEQTGPVFASSPSYAALVNEVMAGAKGLAKVELADIYTKGFGSPMRSGWRVVTANPSTDAGGKGAAKGLLANAVATLESGSGDRAAALTVLRQALAAEDWVRVGYAAHAVGRCKISEEVPTLVALVAKHQDAAVRTLAMWALLQLNDPRSKQTSIEALGSANAELRALAAANLGKLRATEASPALLGLLPKGEGNDERDRASALLALADFGDPAPLLQAAAAVADGQPATLQALAFMFQTLSRKLPAKDEATMLVAVLDHPQPILRRYAIQRLGELREPATARALEGRLGRESRELLPLVQVSLQAVRGEIGDGRQTASERLAALWTRARTTWDNLTPNHRYAALGAVAAVVLLVALVSVLRGRRRARAQGDAWAALAAAPQPPQPVPGRDEVDLNVGESGVYSPHDHDDDSLLRSRTRHFSGSAR